MVIPLWKAFRRSSTPLCLLSLLAAPAAGQCTPVWEAGGAVVGCDGRVTALHEWDPDGAGPLSPVIVAGGSFLMAGRLEAGGVATYDPATGQWASLSSSTTGGFFGFPIAAMATMPNGDLVVGGSFTMIGGVAANSIARWNGTTWSPLGAGVNGYVEDLVVLPGGDLVVGGSFSTAGGIAASNIARWNGATWSPLGAGVSGSVLGVRALALLASGDVVAGGGFSTAGGLAANNIARWNGTTWSSLGVGTDDVVETLKVWNGYLVAGGAFDTAGGIAAARIARWNGASWSPLGSGLPTTLVYGGPNSLAVLPNGNLVAAGQWSPASGGSTHGIARFDGLTWSALGTGIGVDPDFAEVHALAMAANGELFAGGYFTVAGGVSAHHIARWNGSVWSGLVPTPVGASGTTNAVANLPNGDLVVTGPGGFDAFGDLDTTGIARWNGFGWSPFGVGIGGGQALAVMPNGDLIVGGSFTTAGGTSLKRVARWNGSTWSPLGTQGTWNGTNSTVNALAVLPNGDVVAGGTFTTAYSSAGSIPASRVARWDGVTWWPLGAGLNGDVRALVALPNGDLIAAGAFTTAGGVAANRIARWDGAAWSPLGTGFDSTASALALHPDGSLIVGGLFGTAGGVAASRIARWNGTTWSPLGAGVAGGINDVAVQPNGDVVVGGFFTTAGGATANRIARWNGTAWSPLGTGVDNTVTALCVRPQGGIVAVGAFTTAGGTTVNRIAHWDGGTWRPIGPSVNGPVSAAVRLPDGGLLVAGSFAAAGGASANRIARWNGTSWSPLGPGIDGTVWALAVLPSGDFVAGGRFASAGGVAANNIARWNGSIWSPLGTGTDNSVYALAVLPSGDLVAGGWFNSAGGVVAYRIARWDGAGWSNSLGHASSDDVRALATLPNGDLVAAGDFTSIGGTSAQRVARWDGANWHALGGGLGGSDWWDSVNELHVLPNGDLLAAGDFDLPGSWSRGVARWNGATWSSVGSPTGEVHALANLPNGDIVAVNTARQVLRWDGTSWLLLGTASNYTNVLEALPEGDIVVGGHFGQIGGVSAAYLTRLRTSCPPLAMPTGRGCGGTNGWNRLTALTLPWVDTTFRAEGTGLPSPAVVVALTSVTPIPSGLPLWTVFPQAGAGCDLFVAPDILETIVSITGTAQSTLFLPNTPPLVGVTFHHQMVSIELGPVGSWDSVTATNALQLRAGGF